MSAAFVSGLSALLCAWLLTRAFAAGAGPAMLDHPNERSLHEVPTPRTGGLAIVAGIIAGHLTLWMFDVAFPPVAVTAVCAALVLVVSVADDLRDVAPWLRMLVHLGAACGLVLGGLGVERLELPGAVFAPASPALWLFTVLFVVWMTNLYNFMDGMDGFAGGMSVVGFGTYAVLFALAGNPALASSALLVAAASSGFLQLNFPPARIFMGDAGSSVLGFLAAAMALAADRVGAFPLWLAVLVFSPFVVDATVTLLRRCLARERVWQAHRTHFYQRLVRLGWGHRRTTLAEYTLMLACGASAIGLQAASVTVQQTALCVWTGIYVILMVWVTRLECRR